jgi:hypothetical protein
MVALKIMKMVSVEHWWKDTDGRSEIFGKK